MFSCTVVNSIAEWHYSMQNLLIHYSLTKSSQSANLKNPKSGHNQENELKYGFETRVEEPDPVGSIIVFRIHFKSWIRILDPYEILGILIFQNLFWFNYKIRVNENICYSVLNKTNHYFCWIQDPRPNPLKWQVTVSNELTWICSPTLITTIFYNYELTLLC